jgi:hypothetical protein
LNNIPCDMIIIIIIGIYYNIHAMYIMYILYHKHHSRRIIHYNNIVSFSNDTNVFSYYFRIIILLLKSSRRTQKINYYICNNYFPVLR